MLEVVERFVSINGEGAHAGELAVFIRFKGCNLCCSYCDTAWANEPDAKASPTSVEELVRWVKSVNVRNVTLTGGEPLLQADFLAEFRRICGRHWHLCAETSLNVPWEQVATAAACIDHFYIDCKDTDPHIYRQYTGQDNATMLENLQKLLAMIGPERITVRIPLIPEFNTEAHRQNSVALFQKMGLTQFDFFTYKTPQ